MTEFQFVDDLPGGADASDRYADERNACLEHPNRWAIVAGNLADANEGQREKQKRVRSLASAVRTGAKFDGKFEMAQRTLTDEGGTKTARLYMRFVPDGTAQLPAAPAPVVPAAPPAPAPVVPTAD